MIEAEESPCAPSSPGLDAPYTFLVVQTESPSIQRKWDKRIRGDFCKYTRGKTCSG